MFKIFGKHYGTERFFIVMFVCLAVIISMTGYATHLGKIKNQKTIDTQSLYTPEYVWSRTGSPGEVVALASSTDKTRVFMLLRNVDATNTTTFDASQYVVYMKGRDGELMNTPKLTIYSYANSGYVGFYFSDAKGFANQVVSMIIRNDSAASNMANENTFDPNAENDVSFKEHNQIRIYANFGASDMPVLSVLDERDINPLKLFADTAQDLPNGLKVAQTYEDLVTKTNDHLAKMNTQLTTITQYRENLTAAGIRVPDLPYYMAHDVVNTTPVNYDEEPWQFDTSMLEGDDGSSGTHFLVTEDNATNIDATTEESASENTVAGATWTDGDGIVHNYYYLHTDYLYPGTVNLDWQGHTLAYGYINQLNAYRDNVDMSKYKAYNEHKTWMSACAVYKDLMPTSIHYDSWRYDNGSYVDLTNTTDVTGVVQMILAYEEALNSYLETKRLYADDMNGLLDLEASIQQLGTAMTINNGSAEKPNLYTY